MYLQIGAVLAAGVSPLVRVPAGEYVYIKRALDAGAHGIMVPLVNTKVSFFSLRPSLSSNKPNSVGKSLSTFESLLGCGC